MDADLSMFLKVLGGAATAGIAIGGLLSVRSNKQNNKFENDGIMGGGNVINSHNTQVNKTTNNYNGGSPNNNDDAIALMIAAGLGVLGVLYVVFVHFDKIALAVQGIALFAGVGGITAGVVRHRMGLADRNVVLMAFLLAVVGFIAAQLAIDVLSATITPEARNAMVQMGVWEFFKGNTEYSKYALFQIVGLLGVATALCWQVVFAYKKRTLTDDLYGYVGLGLIGSVSYFALSGGLYHLIN